MRLESKFIISCVVVTIGCIILYATLFSPLSAIFFCAPPFIFGTSKLNDPINLKLPKWDIENFLISISVIISIYLVIVIFFQIPKEKIIALLRKLYFVGPLWLLMLASITYGYLKKKRVAQQSAVADP